MHSLLPKALAVLVLLMLITPQNMENNSKCNEATCSEERKEVCVATLGTNGSLESEECVAHRKYFRTCRFLSCARGMSCRVVLHSGGAPPPQDDKGRQVHVGCVYRSDELDRFASVHGSFNGSSESAARSVPATEDDTPIAWCIVISVLSLLPLIVLACIVIYRFVYKLPRIGREKEELTRLFQTLGYDENTEIYKKVIDFFYK